MRKRSVQNIFDNVFWYSIYMLPLIFGLLSAVGTIVFQSQLVSNPSIVFNGEFAGNIDDYIRNSFYSFDDILVDSFDSFFHSFGEDIPFVNFIYTSFYMIDDLLELGLATSVYSDGNFILCYLAWFVTIYMLHLMVDFLLAIPRLCHKWLGSLVED